MTASDDPSIPDSEAALRWIIETKDTVIYNHNEGRWVPTAAAFIRHEDGISAYRALILKDHGHDARDVLATKKDASLVAQIGVSPLRNSIGCGLMNDIPETPIHPIDYAHALITVDPDRSGKARRRQVDAVAHRSQIVLGEVARTPPPL